MTLKIPGKNPGENPGKTLARFLPALAAILLGVGALAAEARQTSIDARIFEAFEKIDGRTVAHEKSAGEMRVRLDDLARDMMELRGKLADLSPDRPELRQRRRLLHGLMIELSAEYLNQSYKLVDSAARVISENLSDLARLAEEARRSEDPAAGGRKLQERVGRNIAVGRSMRDALVQLRSWAGQDPNLVSRFQSLRRITLALDRKVTLDRSRLTGRAPDATGTIRDRRLDALDQTVDRLGDMYAQVMAEKESLKDMRDDVSIAIQMGRLELTQEVARRAIPGIGSLKAPTTGTDPLNGMASMLTDLNDSLGTGSVADPVQQARSPGARLDVDGFTNF